jgi:hypothetical protein
LGEITKDLRLLVVLDDLWLPEQPEAFNRLGRGCRLLVTTRDRRVLERVGGACHELDLLSPDAALALLAEAVGTVPDDLPPEAPDIVRECGHLPFAIASVGALVAKGRFTWAEALDRLRRADLKRLRAVLPDYEHEGVLAALETSVAALHEIERDCFLDCAIFPEDAAVPQAVLVRLWSDRFTDPEEARDTAQQLVDLALLRRDTLGHYRLHDLYHDYLVQAAAPLAERHERLVAAYRRECAAGWASLPADDGYVLDRLPWHLLLAGRSDELRDLLFDLAWLRRKLDAHGPNALVADCSLLPDDPEVAMLGRVLQMSAHVLDRDRRQLAAQLVGRLTRIGGARSRRLLAQASAANEPAVLVPRGVRHLNPPGALIKALEGPGRGIGQLVLLPDGRRALSGGWNGEVLLWDLASGEAHELGRHSSGSVAALAPVPDGRRALSGGWTGEMLLWDLASGKARELRRHSFGPVNALATLPDGRRALSAGSDGSLRLWDLAAGAELRPFFGDDPLSCCIVAQGGAVAATGDATGRLLIFDLPD